MSTKLSQKEAEALTLKKNKEKIILYSSYENDKAFSKFKCLECNNIFTKQFFPKDIIWILRQLYRIKIYS